MMFALRLRGERLAAGLSQEVLSGLCGISQHSWSRYETGRWAPRLEHLVAIADVLDVSADYLLGRTDERKNLAL